MSSSKRKRFFFLSAYSCNGLYTSIGWKHPPTMQNATRLASIRPPLPTESSALLAATTTNTIPTTSTELLPLWEELYIVTVIVIFSSVCFLLLLALSYTFCFHCSIASVPKDSRAANGSHMEREDATYRCSSPDGNVV